MRFGRCTPYRAFLSTPVLVLSRVGVETAHTRTAILAFIQQYKYHAVGKRAGSETPLKIWTYWGVDVVVRDLAC